MKSNSLFFLQNSPRAIGSLLRPHFPFEPLHSNPHIFSRCSYKHRSN